MMERLSGVAKVRVAAPRAESCRLLCKVLLGVDESSGETEGRGEVGYRRRLAATTTGTTRARARRLRASHAAVGTSTKLSAQIQ